MESGERSGVTEMGSQRITAPDHQVNELIKHENGGVAKPDSFIVDLQNFTNGLDKEPITNSTTISRITLQRSLSRKGPQRGAERHKINDRDPLAPSSSPKAVQVVSMPEKPLPPTGLPMGSPDHSTSSHLPQHQITIKTGGISTVSDGRWGKRSSFKRSSYSWFSDPKRIVLFFATLSSMGTILLIYFTLSMSKPSESEGGLDWQ